MAEAARSRYGDGDDVIDLLARHLYLAEAGASAVDALVRAANRARTLFANDEAILAFERAIEVAESESARESGRDHDESASLAARLPELRLAVADLRRLVGDYAGAEAAYRSAARATDDLRAWAGVAATLRDRGDTGAALAVLYERLAICMNPLRQSTVFPPMVVQMISVGEETGALDEMLKQVSDYYDSEVEYAVKNLTAMIEPIIILFMGVGAVFLIVAILMPYMTILSNFGSGGGYGSH